MSIKIFMLWKTWSNFPVMPGDNNLADGIVQKFNSPNANKVPIGYTVGRIIREGGKEYGTSWIHIGQGYYKNIYKTEEDGS